MYFKLCCFRIRQIQHFIGSVKSVVTIADLRFGMKQRFISFRHHSFSFLVLRNKRTVL